MKAETKQDVFFVIFLCIVLTLAVMYFSVPERNDFFEYQLDWWGEFLRVLRSGIKEIW